MSLGEIVMAVAGLLGTLFAYLALNKSRRSEAHIWIENAFHIGIFIYAAYVLFSFCTATGQPSRSSILVAIMYTLIIIWAPKAVIDGIFLRREMARTERRIAMMNEYLKPPEGRPATSRPIVKAE